MKNMINVKTEKLLKQLKEELKYATDDKEIDMLEEAIRDLEYEPMTERGLRNDM